MRSNASNQSKYSLPAWESRSPEEEYALWTAMKSGDTAAREKLITNVMWYVWKMVNGCPDKMQEAMLAVIAAIDGEFDPTKGRLTTYITRRVRWMLSKRQDTLIHTPQGQPLLTIWYMGVGSACKTYDDEMAEAKDAVRLLSRLNERERDVIIRCVMNNESLASVARSYDLSKERIRQIREGALEKMRNETQTPGDRNLQSSVSRQ